MRFSVHARQGPRSRAAWASATERLAAGGAKMNIVAEARISEVSHWIAGALVPATSVERLIFTIRRAVAVSGLIGLASASDVDAAVCAAKAAFSSWSKHRRFAAQASSSTQRAS